MIFEELIRLKDFITRECTVNAEIGERDRAVASLPMVEIIPRDIPVFDQGNELMRHIQMPIELRIITDRKDEIRAITIFETICKKIGGFSRSSGTFMGESFSASYETSVYTLTGTLRLMFRVHDSE